MKSLPILVAFAALASTPKPSDACSPPIPYALGRVVPQDGATGVPTNVQVRVFYGSASDRTIAGAIRVRPVGGEAVDASVTTTGNAGNPFPSVVLVAPAAPLAPQTSYEVVGRIPRDCHFQECVTDAEVLATFTTGDGPDVTPPSFEGLKRIELGHRFACADSACCGPYDIVRFSLKWDDATDDSGIAAYHVYAGSTGGTRVVSAGGGEGVASCSGHFSGGGPGGDFFAGSNTYFVRAVDLAGNEDANEIGIPISIDCAATSTDGGPTDAGPTTSDGGSDAEEPEPDSGCAATSAAAGSAVGALLVLVRRRRRT